MPSSSVVQENGSLQLRGWRGTQVWTSIGKVARGPTRPSATPGQATPSARAFEGFNDWGGRGYDDFVPGEVIKTAPFGDEPT